MATVRRLFVEPSQDPNTLATLPLAEEEQHYARTVLRLVDGDFVMLADGAGHEAPARLRVQSKRCMSAEMTEPFTQSPALAQAATITMVCPLVKGERADWMAEKLSEFGIARLVLVQCVRSVVLPKGAGKPDRLLRLMRAAARQARHGRIPELVGPMPLMDFLTTASLPQEAKFVADAQGIAPHRALATLGATPRTIVVGPEGGLTEDELQAAIAQGYGLLSLGPHILRAETAAMACAVLMGQRFDPACKEAP
jgi:16S rRNA (uracil1498-N3)-methyltransferase